MSNQRALRLHERDNIAVALTSLTLGSNVEQNLQVSEHINSGHKIATRDISSGESIIKYGNVIGVATSDIKKGHHVHEHNVSMTAVSRSENFGAKSKVTEYSLLTDRATFNGYVRSNGEVGTRNYVGIVTSVNCSASVANMIAREASNSGLLADYPNVDGIVPIVHGAGCCIKTDDEAFGKLQRALWGYANHPNFASILMLGLGCEANQIPAMLEAYNKEVDEAFQYFTLQSAGGTRRSIEKGLQWLEKALQVADKSKRELVDASHLKLALQCGGSDGYSGITANPALGYAVDLLVRDGGCAALAETPEIYGAEK